MGEKDWRRGRWATELWAGGAEGAVRVARKRGENSAREWDRAAPRAHFDSLWWGRMRGARAAWRAVARSDRSVQSGRSLTVHGAVA